MGYKDKEKQASYQNKWLIDRKRKWVTENGPCKKCGSDKELTVSKSDLTLKTVKVFSYSEAYRNEILAKCEVLCRKCHVAKFSEIFKKRYTGNVGGAKCLTPSMVWSIRGRLLGKESMRQIADAYGLTHKTVGEIKSGHTWSWLKAGRRNVYGIVSKEEKKKRPSNERVRTEVGQVRGDGKASTQILRISKES